MIHRTIASRLGHVLATVGLACAFLTATRIAEGLYGDLSRPDGPLRAGRAPLGRPDAGDTVARLSVRRLGLDCAVLEGVGDRVLAEGAGLVPGTALPGERGRSVSVIAIARDRACAGLSALHLGESLEARTPFGTRTYSVVERQILPPTEVHLDAGEYPRVLLVLPYPADALGPAPYRLTIIAEDRSPTLVAGHPPRFFSWRMPR